MENASKALIMSAGIFLALVILALGVTLFVSHRNVAENYDKTLSLQEVARINKNFEKYLASDKDGKITIQEAISAARTARDYNEKYGNGTITVLIDGTNFSDISKTNTQYADKVNAFMKTIYAGTGDDHGKVYRIYIDSYYEEEDPYPGLIRSVRFTH